MRRLILLLLLVGVTALALYRQRLFLRDPLGRVLVNGVPVNGARVFINYSNDVLTERDGGADAVIVQRWDRVVGRPEGLVCLQALACLTSDDHAPKTVRHGAVEGAAAEMTDRAVSYRDEAGATVRVIVR